MKKRAWLAVVVLTVLFYSQPIFAEAGSPGTCEYWQGKWELIYSSSTDNVTITDVCVNDNASATQPIEQVPACMLNRFFTCMVKGTRASDGKQILIAQTFIDKRIYAYYETWSPGSDTPYDAVHYRDFVDVEAYIADPFGYTGGYTAMLPNVIDNCSFVTAINGSYTVYSQAYPNGAPYANAFGLVSGARLTPECINSTTTTTTIDSTTTTTTDPLTSQACADWMGVWDFTYNVSNDNNPTDNHTITNGAYEITIDDFRENFQAGPIKALCYATGTRTTDAQAITIMQPDNATLANYAQYFPGVTNGTYLYYEASGQGIGSAPFAKILPANFSGENFTAAANTVWFGFRRKNRQRNRVRLGHWHGDG